MKNVVRIICAIVFASSVIFYLKDISFILYISSAIPVALFIVVSYCFFKNQHFFLFYGLAAGSNLAVFLSQKYQIGYRVTGDVLDIIFIVYAAVIFFVFILNRRLVKIFTFLGCRRNHIKKIEKDEENLFPERTHDLYRVMRLLRKYNTIGVQSKWGDGKTFLFDMLEKECKSRYYFVKIGVMSVTVDNVEKFILNEINHLLESEGIFSLASAKINNLLSCQSTVNAVSGFFFKSKSFTDQVCILKRDVLKLKKRIVLVFEDIDRITNEVVIYKIFSIVETLCNDYIKCVYQYHERTLLDTLRKDKVYLEKYIQHTTCLTPLLFLRAVEKLCKNRNYSVIKKEDFDFITLDLPVSSIISKKLQFHGVLKMKIPSFSIRKVILFLDDIDASLSRIDGPLDELRKKVTILFYFMKHFLYDLFDKITMEEKFIDLKLFKYQGEQCSLEFFLRNISYIHTNEFWDDEQNRQAMAMLVLLGYDLKPIVDSIEKEVKE